MKKALRVQEAEMRELKTHKNQHRTNKRGKCRVSSLTEFMTYSLRFATRHHKASADCTTRRALKGGIAH